MLDINENMDELFRRAAKDYPLDTGTPDFNLVLQKMNEVPAKKDPGNSKWFLLLWLLMLLPLALIHHFNPQQIKTGLPALATPLPASQLTVVNNDVPQLPDVLVTDQSDNTAKLSNEYREKNGTSSLRSIDENKGYGSDRKKTTRENPKLAISLSAATTEDDYTEDNSQQTYLQEESKLNESENPFIPVEVSDNEQDQPEEIKTVEPEVPSDALVAPEEKDKNNNKRFYAGIIGGADLTSIKMQSVKKTGYSAGIIAGYEINKNWSIETGLLYDRKYYSTDGKYFNPKYALPYNATIEYADGNCDMLEVPLNMRYNFNQDRKLSWYVLSGFSSYFMKEESYVYAVNHNGNRYPKAMEYNNPATSLFSVMNFGGGLSYKLGAFNLGLEPYIKLPLRKVGTGDLPLQSGGVNLRITTKIF